MKLHEYQEYARRFIWEHPHCLLLLDMGLGKTLTTLTAMSEMLMLGEVDNVLVIAPLRVAQDTWSDEVAKWPHLQHLRVSKVLGTPAQRKAALETDADIYVINRENVVWLVDHYKTKWPFKTVVIDELSSFKSSQSKRWRALRKVRPKMTRTIGLTGTPAPNSLVDLWSQVYLIDQGERLGRTKTSYLNKYFYPALKNGNIVYKYSLKDDAENDIYERLSDICISMKSKDYLNLPDVTHNVLRVPLGASGEKIYKQLKRDYVLELKDGPITAANAAVLVNKLLQVANGAIYSDLSLVQHVHDAKLDALQEIVDEAQGQPLLVFYQFRHDLKRLLHRFPQAEELTDIKRWNNGDIPMLLVHPQSAGHGLNLQHGGHIIVWFGLNWSLEYYQQANARLARQGQTHPVTIHHLVARDTIDERVMGVLAGKAAGQDALMKAVKAELGVTNE